MGKAVLAVAAAVIAAWALTVGAVGEPEDHAEVVAAALVVFAAVVIRTLVVPRLAAERAAEVAAQAAAAREAVCAEVGPAVFEMRRLLDELGLASLVADAGWADELASAADQARVEVHESP